MKGKLGEYLSGGNWQAKLEPLVLNLVVTIVIYFVGIWIASLIVKFIDKIMELRELDEALREFLTTILSVLLKFAVILISLDQLGIDTTSLIALLGAAGLAVGLALKDSLSNFAAGVMLIVFKPFTIGNYIEAGGTAGVVEKITVFNTVCRSGDNKQIVVPNSQIVNGTIVNYSAKPTRRIDLVIGIGYDDDIKKARDLLEEIMAKDERILKDPAPVVAVDALADSSVNLVVRPWVNSGDFWDVKWHLLETIKTTFDENGVSIPYPQQDVHMHSVASNN